MNTFTLSQFQRSTGSVAINASGAMLEGIQLTMDLCRWFLPHAIRFGWETLDSAMAVGRSSTIAVGTWLVDAAQRYQQWCDDPQNKERVNQAVDEISVYAQRGFKIWCWAVSTTIETGYNSRPHVERAISLGRDGFVQATVLTRFLLALRMLMTRQDYEEVEEYQTALPAAPRSVALLPPAKVVRASEDDPWIAPAKVAAISAAPVAEDAAETPLLLALAPDPESKTAKATGRRTSKTSKASGNRSRKTTSNGRKPAKGDRKSNTNAKEL